MQLIEWIDNRRNKAIKLTRSINDCSKTAAGTLLKRDFMDDREKLYYEIGKLVCNSAVKICLQSDFTR